MVLWSPSQRVCPILFKVKVRDERRNFFRKTVSPGLWYNMGCSFFGEKRNPRGIQTSSTACRKRKKLRAAVPHSAHPSGTPHHHSTARSLYYTRRWVLAAQFPASPSTPLSIALDVPSSLGTPMATACLEWRQYQHGGAAPKSTSTVHTALPPKTLG